ncbi:MAG: hypothetical protein ACI9YL_000827, partial [Luteibaculaceae bacterium]
MRNWHTVIIALCFFGVLDSHESNAQGSCAVPVTIAALPYSGLGLSTCQNNNFNSGNACANTYIDDTEYIYTFTPTVGSECFEFTLNNTDNTSSPSLFIFDQCPSLVGTSCVYQGVSPDGWWINRKSLSARVNLTAGQQYFIVVSTNTGGAGCYDFDLNITAVACVPFPEGSSCDNPTAIAALPYAPGTQFTTCDKPKATNMGNSCNGTTMYNGNDYVFEYKPPTDQCVVASLERSLDVSGLYVFDGCPSDPTSSCVDLNVEFTYDKQLALTLTGGQTYYFIISSRFPNDECGTFEFELKEVTADGEDCARAIPLSLPASLDNETTHCKGDDYDRNPLCGSNFGRGDEVVYSFTLTNTTCVGILASGFDNSGGLFLKAECPELENPCIDFKEINNPTDGDLSIDATLGPGTYYVIVGSRNNGEDQVFDLDIVTDDGNSEGATCANAVDISSLPYDTTGVSTLCKGDDYNSGETCNSDFVEGNDMVFSYTSAGNECITATIANMTHTGGFYLMDDCPDNSGNCLESVVCESDGCDSLRMEYTITAPGTYYFIISGAENINVQSFDFHIDSYSTSSCENCNDDLCTACKNAGLEEMSFDGWSGFYGGYNNPRNNNGFQPGETNQQTDSRHTIMSVGSYDPLIGPDLPLTPPNGSHYSMKLGNRNVGAEAEVAEYTFTVDADNNNVLYWYAVVFEDPNHIPDEQPFFMIRMFDASDNEILCAHYEVRAGPSIPGFLDGPGSIRWTNWTPVSIPVNDFLGQQVRVEFTNKDCDLGGHFGYSYLDVECSKLEISGDDGFICEKYDTIPLTAPDGYATYVWNTGDSTRIIQIDSAGTYSVQMTTVTGCFVNLDFVVTSILNPTADYNFDVTCGDSLFTFLDSSFAQD